MEYRNELKFLCSAGQMAILQARLRPLLRPDAHQAGGAYAVRSLYFDDADNTGYADKLDGVDDRRKYRLRVYGHSAELVRLEIKHRYRGLVQKQGCTLSREEAEALTDGRCPAYRKDWPPPMQRLYVAMRGALLRPRVIVEYERTAFVSPLGNVRVSFDRHVSMSPRTGDFLQPALPLTPVLPVGQHVLEVKYDEYIPDFILQTLELGALMPTAFSKYMLCRMASA